MVEEELHYLEIKIIFKLLIVKDVLPPTQPIRNVRTFQDLCRYFIFPFMLTTVTDNSGRKDEGDGESSSGPGVQDSSGHSFGHVELWGRPPGLLSSQALVMFLKNRCNVSLHNVGDKIFRLSLTLLDV